MHFYRVCWTPFMECHVFSFKNARTSQKSRVFPFTFHLFLLVEALQGFGRLWEALKGFCGRQFLSRVDILIQFYCVCWKLYLKTSQSLPNPPKTSWSLSKPPKASQNLAKPAEPSKASQSLPKISNTCQSLTKPPKALQSLKEQEQMESERKNTRLLWRASIFEQENATFP